MKTLCIVQARMASSRLPGKVLEDLGGISVIDLLLKRASSSKTIDELVVATSTNPSDDQLVLHLNNLGVKHFRGSEYDVLKRFLECADTFTDLSAVVRVTADCPFIDPSIVDLVVESFVRENLDYCSNRLPPPYTRTYPVGLDVEVFTYQALVAAEKRANAPYEREHVTPFIYDPKNGFNLKVLSLDEDLSDIRLTIDEPEDLEFCQAVYEKMVTDYASWQEIVEAAGLLVAGNKNVKQKNVSQVDHRWADNN